jgi:hypothetical protein
VVVELLFLCLLGMWLAYTIVLPEQWARLVERTHEFEVRHGIESRRTAERCKRFEKGWGLKGILLFGLVVQAAGIVVQLVLGAMARR